MADPWWWLYGPGVDNPIARFRVYIGCMSDEELLRLEKVWHETGRITLLQPSSHGLMSRMQSRMILDADEFCSLIKIEKGRREAYRRRNRNRNKALL